jgi:hypothetical protein
MTKRFLDHAKELSCAMPGKASALAKKHDGPAANQASHFPYG